jgi:hypothetical protein
VEFQWFLMAFAGRPDSNLDIKVHLLPCLACASIIISSSSAVQLSLRTVGHK